MELTNLRYKEYLKRAVAVKYKVELPPPDYQPEPSAYVDCGCTEKKNGEIGVG